VLKETKKLTEGAMLAALYLLVLLMVLYIPLIGIIIIWFLPLPFIIYVLRQGLKAGIVLFSVTLLGSLIVGGIIVLPLTILFGVGGIVVGELYRREKPAFAVLLGGSLAYIANLIVYFVLSILIFKIHPLHATQELMRQSVESAEFMLVQIGQESADQLDQFHEFIDVLPDLLPLIIVFVGISYALFIQLIASSVLKKLKFPIAVLPAFRNWKFPKAFLWYYLIVLVLLLIGVEPGTSIYLVVINLLPLLEIIMAIQGLSFLFYFCYEKKISKALPIMVIILIFILPGIMYLIRILGIMDLGFDLRKRVNKV
jgi:uncharacterized protein YybS (DUF2232 family)